MPRKKLIKARLARVAPHVVSSFLSAGSVGSKKLSKNCRGKKKRRRRYLLVGRSGASGGRGGAEVTSWLGVTESDGTIAYAHRANWLVSGCLP